MILNVCKQCRQMQMIQSKEYRKEREASNYSTVLKSLIESADKNYLRDPKGRRFDEPIRSYSTYLYLMSGKACYEGLCANLPIPQADTVLRYINEKKQRIIEGELRCDGLKQYLENLHLPMCVWISEDASGINAKVEYDPATKQMVGLVLPLSSTGMPVPFQFLATSADEILKHVNKPTSQLVYIVLAQPLLPKVPPFLIQVFGTDNKFTTINVIERWKFIETELEKFGIKVAGFSSDGDIRLLNTMLHNINFNDSETIGVCYMQDILHAVLKIRNRILNSVAVLPMGKYLVSISHLKLLIYNVPKDEHSLVMKDICPDDKQNFKALQKIMQPNVLAALSNNIKGSEGTIQYIKIMSNVASSLYEDHLAPLDRVYRANYATYFLRIWREWILSHGGFYTLSDNFITSNAYACVEINTYNLLKLIKIFRDKNMDEYFVPVLFNSQPCEETFRKMRSMGTINFTKINFSLLELLHLVGRVELLNDIMYFKLNNFDIKFPRNKISKENLNKFKLPNDQQLQDTCERARSDAITAAAKLGMVVAVEKIQRCELKQLDLETIIKKSRKRKAEKALNDFVGEEDEEDFILHPQCTNARNYSHKVVDLENSPFVEVINDDGTKTMVRTSTLIWIASNEKGKLSSDRLKRVQSAGPSKGKFKSCKRRLVFDESCVPELNINKLDEIRIGDWCIFQWNGTDCTEQKTVVGQILSFKYIDGKNVRQKQYTWDFVPVQPDPEVKKRGIEVLASWIVLNCNEQGDYSEYSPFTDNKCFFITIENYVKTISRSPIESDDFSPEFIRLFAEFSKTLQNVSTMNTK